MKRYIDARTPLFALLLTLVAVCGSCTDRRSWDEINESAKSAHAAGQLEQADKDFRAALEMARSLGADDVRLVTSLNNLGSFKLALGRTDEAVQYL